MADYKADEIVTIDVGSEYVTDTPPFKVRMFYYYDDYENEGFNQLMKDDEFAVDLDGEGL